MSGRFGRTPPGKGAAKDGDDKDPSMDDILASIRRILNDKDVDPDADDDDEEDVLPAAAKPQAAATPPAAGKPAAPPAPPAAAAPAAAAPAEAKPADPKPAEAKPVDAKAPEAKAADAKAPDAKPAIDTAAAKPAAPAPSAAAAAEEPEDVLILDDAMMIAENEAPKTGADSLVDPNTASAAASSVSALKKALAERNTTVAKGGVSLEEIIRDEFRPMLKSWLDTHLPGIVEKLVRAEIERVVTRELS